MNRALSRQGGFTLIELMIVVAVIAVLAVIAYPTYQDSVRKGRRGEAKSDLVELAQAMERCFTVNNTYLTCPNIHNGTNVVPPLNQSPQAGNRAGLDYGIDFTVVPTRTTFALAAVPVAGSDQANDTCGTMTLNQTGAKGSSGTGTNCW